MWGQTHLFVIIRSIVAGGLFCALVVGCSDLSTDIGPRDRGEDLIEVSGQLSTLDGGSPGRLKVLVEGASGVIEAEVGHDGSFSLANHFAGDSLSVMIVGSGFERRYHPTLLVLPLESVTDIEVLLIPRSWRIRGGRYAGELVDISLAAAFRPPCGGMGDINCDGFYPRNWLEDLKLWRVADLPIPLALSRSHSTSLIEESDSLAFWSIVDEMNADLGREFFVPVAESRLEYDELDRPIGGVTVYLDRNLIGYGAWANWWWNARGEITSGRVRLAESSSFSSASLMTHELVHILGFKHSCSWPTVMGGYGCAAYDGLSPGDVAHIELAMAVNELVRESGIEYGLVEALQGERVVELGLAPLALPAAPLKERVGVDGVGEPIRLDPGR